MEEDKNSPKVGDLIYCHAIGSRYSWYIDQLGIILEIVAKPLLPASPKNKIYKIWLMDQTRYQWVESRDFNLGNIEVIRKESGEVMYGKSFGRKRKDS
tara:strand:- start:468 stop:761 length:294 start_codon:yes stop_codon:yes gene_type:complete